MTTLGDFSTARRWVSPALVFVALVLVLSVASAGSSAGATSVSPRGDSARAQPPGKIDPRVLEDTAGGRSAGFAVLLEGQADLSRAYGMRDQDERGWYVYRTLSDYAVRSQAALRALLDGRGLQYQSFWAANMVLAYGGRGLVEELAARSDVKLIEPSRTFRVIDDPAPTSAYGAAPSPRTIQWGVENVNAPDVWGMGFTGQGMVIGVIDTGVRWTHDALKPHYRGWDGSAADHNYNWWDAVAGSLAPLDPNGHGTHTTGTAIGDDGQGAQIGVAPGAKWVGCRAIDAGGGGNTATFTACFQFFIAPTDLNGQNPDPTKRPHVVNNSWGCPSGSECYGSALEQVVNNMQAAGIFVETQVGGGGPGCETVTSPGIFAAGFAAGAIDINNTLASFSSRGPSTYYTPNIVKPNLSAPGVNVTSAYNDSDNSYYTMSGTGMAAPHVGGTVALLWSAHPELSRMITETKQILQDTANRDVAAGGSAPYCGGTPPTQIPNNYFGYGRVDALAAVNAIGQATPTPGATASATPAAGTVTPVPPTPCTISFTDVPPENTFYPYVRCLACRGVLGGYSDGTFRPNNNVTRGQTAKIVSNAAAYADDVTGRWTFEDVPNTNPFWVWVERVTLHYAMNGYACGGAPNEPCTCPGHGLNCIYFRPYANATRAQLAKIDSNAAGYNDDPTTQTFTDVDNTHPFYVWIERLASRGIMGGYACGGPGEPCDPRNRPYFRPYNEVTRGQASKIVANTFYPNCQTPR